MWDLEDAKYWRRLLPGRSFRLAIAAALWLSYSTKAKPRFLDLSAALGYTMTSTTPSVTFFISVRISSRFLVLGIPPTNRRQLSTLAQTPRRRPVLMDKMVWLDVCSAVSVRDGGALDRNHQNEPDLVVVELLHGCFGFQFGAEGDKGVASVVSVEVHHHSHLVDLTKLEEEGAVEFRTTNAAGLMALIRFEWVNKRLTFSHSGTSSSSNRSRGSFPTKISLPLSGGGPSQSGGGPPYRRWPFS